MWVVVNFIRSNDVSAVLFAWIRTDEETGETSCFWPRKDAEKKRCNPKLKASEGTFYPCKILMGGAKFDTFEEAIKMEIRAQDTSSAETTNDENTTKKRKRVPKKISSSEESSYAKQRKPAKKKEVSSDEESFESSDVSLSDSEQMDFDFKRFRTIRLRDCFKNFGDLVPKDAVEIVNAKRVTVLDSVTIVAADDHHNPTSSEPDNDMTVQSPTITFEKTDDAVLLPSDEDFVSYSNGSLIAAAVPNLYVNGCEQQFDSNSPSDIQEIGAIISIPHQNEELVNKLFEKISKLNEKMDLLVNNQEGLKAVIVDLTYKVLRVEEQMELKNTQQLTLSLELSVPIADPESFELNEAALKTKKATADNLVSYICSINFQSELDPFIRDTFEKLFDLDFFYKTVIWKTEPKKINIKDTEVMKCIVGSVRGRFPDLKMKPDELHDLIYKTGKKLKDAYRKRPPKTI